VTLGAGDVSPGGHHFAGQAAVGLVRQIAPLVRELRRVLDYPHTTGGDKGLLSLDDLVRRLGNAR
jgi:hypothetical protein